MELTNDDYTDKAGPNPDSLLAEAFNKDEENTDLPDIKEWVKNWMESFKPDTEFELDKHGRYMYKSPSGRSTINLAYFFQTAIEDYLEEVSLDNKESLLLSYERFGCTDEYWKETGAKEAQQQVVAFLLSEKKEISKKAELRKLKLHPHTGHPYWQQGEWKIEMPDGSFYSHLDKDYQTLFRRVNPGKHYYEFKSYGSYKILVQKDGIYFSPHSCSSGSGKQPYGNPFKIIDASEFDLVEYTEPEKEFSETLLKDLKDQGISQ